MKKILFAIMALSVMSSASYAADGIRGKVKHHAKKSCPKGCTNSKDCRNTSTCYPGCGCC